ncbi:MAG: GIY-YIG nuclease family protein [Sedimentisphaerales bacterium]
MQNDLRSFSEAGIKPNAIIKRLMEMMYVYLLESISHPGQRYVGITGDLKARIKDHNTGRSSYTSKYAPWQTKVVIKFTNDRNADSFERYLKSGSGHAFAQRHFW